MTRRGYLGAACVVMLLASCRQEQGTVIARVGDAVLTLEEASQAIDSSRGPAANQLRAYVSSWVTTELLHQEAQKSGVENTEEFRRQVRDINRQLAVQDFLEQHVYPDLAVYSDSMLEGYFNAHAPEFFLREDMVKLNMIVLKNRERASSFAASVSQGTPWGASAQKYSQDSVSSPDVVFSRTEQVYSRRTLFPTELWKVASALAINEVSFPVKTAEGFAVMQLLAKMREGREAEFWIVRDEVYQRVRLERRRSRYEKYLDSLRKSYNIQVLLPPAAPADTLENSLNE